MRVLVIGGGAILWGVAVIFKLLSEIGVPLVEDMFDYGNMPSKKLH